MSEFNPSPHDRLVIGGRVFQVMPHPSVPAFAFGQEGRKAFVYQLSNGGDGSLYALKKFKPAYRVPELAEVCDSLARFAQWPGMEVCARECLHYGQHDDALEKFPDLEYAVLMPWITGSTWHDVVIGSKPLTRLDALTVASATAQALAALEEAGLAHCDISAPNVIINLTSGHTHLIDVEDLYAPGFNSPAALPAGTEGYAHKTASNGLWRPAADRFAGAVMLAEMMGWHTPEIRKASDEEHYFAASETQVDSPRFQLMLKTMAAMDQRLSELLRQAWQSDQLEDCPPMKDWNAIIGDVFHREQLSKVVSDWQPITGSDVKTEAAPPPSKQPISPAPAAAPAPPQPSAPQAIVNPRSTPAPILAGKIAPMPSTGPVVEWRPLVVAGSMPASQPVTMPQPAPESARSPSSPALLKPLLDLSHVDKRNRPFLVWSESVGADYYLLQEAKTSNFESVKEHRIAADETHWNPTWGRSGRLYYRVQARSDGDASPWSKTLIVRLGAS